VEIWVVNFWDVVGGFEQAFGIVVYVGFAFDLPWIWGFLGQGRLLECVVHQLALFAAFACCSCHPGIVLLQCAKIHGSMELAEGAGCCLLMSVV
jgi:hypothetical protein